MARVPFLLTNSRVSKVSCFFEGTQEIYVVLIGTIEVLQGPYYDPLPYA